MSSNVTMFSFQQSYLVWAVDHDASTSVREKNPIDLNAPILSDIVSRVEKNKYDAVIIIIASNRQCAKSNRNNQIVNNNSSPEVVLPILKTELEKRFARKDIRCSVIFEKHITAHINNSVSSDSLSKVYEEGLTTYFDTNKIILILNIISYINNNYKKQDNRIHFLFTDDRYDLLQNTYDTISLLKNTILMENTSFEIMGVTAHRFYKKDIIDDYVIEYGQYVIDCIQQIYYSYRTIRSPEPSKDPTHDIIIGKSPNMIDQVLLWKHMVQNFADIDEFKYNMFDVVFQTTKLISN